MTVARLPRVVLDCMIWLQAAIRPHGPAAAVIGKVDEGEIDLVVSSEILREIRDVLSRPSIRRANPDLTDERVDTLFATIGAHATVVDAVPVVISLPRDPKDEPYINLAIACGADYLISWDNDILDLASDADFLANHPDLSILNPVAFLQTISP